MTNQDHQTTKHLDESSSSPCSTVGETPDSIHAGVQEWILLDSPSSTSIFSITNMSPNIHNLRPNGQSLKYKPIEPYLKYTNRQQLTTLAQHGLIPIQSSVFSVNKKSPTNAESRMTTCRVQLHQFWEGGLVGFIKIFERTEG